MVSISHAPNITSMCSDYVTICGMVLILYLDMACSKP